MHGELGDVEVGQIFSNRKECRLAGIHRADIAGIAGYGGGQPVESIVVAGGYEDDEDYGELIIYTGEGGNDPNTGKQIADQKLTKGNLGLSRNVTSGTPVRVVRSIGPNHKGPPYRYDGLFSVTEQAQQIGASGFYVYRFRLEQMAEFAVLTEAQLPLGTTEPKRQSTTTQRVVRQTAVSNSVKVIHDFVCQICATRITLPTGRYAEAAHIRPLGRPHDGPDVVDNVLCLCPNCHVLFDRGAIGVSEDYSLINTEGSLRQRRRHSVSRQQLAYHRSQHKLD